MKGYLQRDSLPRLLQGVRKPMARARLVACKGECGMKRSLNQSGYCVSCWLRLLHPLEGRALRAQVEKLAA